MRLTLLSTTILHLALFTAQETIGQDQGMIFGTVTTYENEVYEGPIRWGKEEVFWVDIFNAAKTENPYLGYLDREQKARLQQSVLDQTSAGWGSSMAWLGLNEPLSWTASGGFTHQFACPFGSIRKIKPRRGNRVEIETRNGQTFEVSGSGYNDVGAEIHVLDKEIGEVEIKWDRIARIEFNRTPEKLSTRFGAPLFGTVETTDGNFSGLIQWDQEERLSTDQLDGYMEDGKVAIDFGKIATIERMQGKCKIGLTSGRSLELRGTNDVNQANRGIVVYLENGASVTIPWVDFRKVRFENPKPGILPDYEDFKNPQPIQATVKTTGNTYSGKTILDLDEEFDFELLQGKNGEMEYVIPIRAIASLRTKGRNGSDITLRSGDKIQLKDSPDVGQRNQGTLVFPEKGKPSFILWEEIEEISFR